MQVRNPSAEQWRLLGVVRTALVVPVVELRRVARETDRVLVPVHAAGGHIVGVDKVAKARRDDHGGMQPLALLGF